MLLLQTKIIKRRKRDFSKEEITEGLARNSHYYTGRQPTLETLKRRNTDGQVLTKAKGHVGVQLKFSASVGVESCT